MRTSETIGKLAGALAKAQGEFKPVQKTRTANVGSYKYDYADLADIIEGHRVPLSANGLAIVQAIDNDEKGSAILTRLMHDSGEWVEASYRLPVATGQAFGSALTYGRRYSYASIIGIQAEDDDDGAAAEKKPVEKPVSSATLLKTLREQAQEAKACERLDAFRVDDYVKATAGKLSPAHLAEFKEVIKDLDGLAK